MKYYFYFIPYLSIYLPDLTEAQGKTQDPSFQRTLPIFPRLLTVIRSAGGKATLSLYNRLRLLLLSLYYPGK